MRYIHWGNIIYSGWALLFGNTQSRYFIGKDRNYQIWFLEV